MARQSKTTRIIHRLMSLTEKSKQRSYRKRMNSPFSTPVNIDQVSRIPVKKKGLAGIGKPLLLF